MIVLTYRTLAQPHYPVRPRISHCRHQPGQSSPALSQFAASPFPVGPLPTRGVQVIAPGQPRIAEEHDR